MQTNQQVEFYIAANQSSCSYSRKSIVLTEGNPADIEFACIYKRKLSMKDGKTPTKKEESKNGKCDCKN